MDELRRDAISDSLFGVRIEAMINMVKHEAEVIENFDIKGAIIKLGEKQVLIERKLKEISEEMERVKNELCEVKKGLIDSGKG